MSAVLPSVSSVHCVNSYVSRKHPHVSDNHEILGVQQVKPEELAQIAALDVGNAWGVLQAIIDTLRGFPQEGKTSKYLILKDPNKVNLTPVNCVLRSYSMPCKPGLPA